MRELSVPGAWVHTPEVHSDGRGTLHEAFRAEAVTAATGHPPSVAQANVCTTHRGAIRGVHYADVPPGQAKYVSCLRGAVLDVIVDLRVGSPSFGRWDAVELSEENHRSVYLAEGLGHALMGLTSSSAVMYLCSRPYTPAHEHGIHPLDPALALPWPADVPALLSDRDAQAPTLAEATRLGLLPRYDACR
ncbi:dTDP-4-dehydrorhamnose 3,5-epimerase [Streptomyces sp. NPDC029080]|uniref:dTDP-4-dehydrorhamnose 3,5-epimerase family protein n=1 Tax=Streptomyces sp. NPDC029080 TaxID=3155017 RepID=UPI0033EC48C6